MGYGYDYGYAYRRGQHLGDTGRARTPEGFYGRATVRLELISSCTRRELEVTGHVCGEGEDEGEEEGRGQCVRRARTS